MRKEGEASLEYETVNQAKALWTRPRSEITDEEYQRVLPARRARLRRSARLEPQPGRGQARVHEPALRPGARAVRPVAARGAARPQAVRAARLHHGRRRAVPAAVPALRQGRGRFRATCRSTSRASCCSRTPEVEAHPQRPHQARARHCWRKLAKDEPEKYADVLEGVRRGAEGRPRPGSRPTASAAAAAALRQHSRGRRRARRSASPDTCSAHAGRARTASTT